MLRFSLKYIIEEFKYSQSLANFFSQKRDVMAYATYNIKRQLTSPRNEKVILYSFT